MKIAQMLEEGARRLGVELSAERIELFQVYMAELKKWNRVVNLTSIVEDEKIVSNHFLDAISCLVSNKIGPDSKVVDLGAGAGFPGIPLKIVRPSLCLTLIDSAKKKTDFLKFLIKKLNLADVEVVYRRAEEFAKESSRREGYDIVVARAITSLPTLIEYSLPLLKLGGTLIAQKGKENKRELKQGAEAASVLGGKIENLIKVDVPFLAGERHLIVVSKSSPTPLKFPRRTGVARKRPLGKD